MVRYVNTIIIFLVCFAVITGLVCIKKYKTFVANKELNERLNLQYSQIEVYKSTFIPVNSLTEVKGIISDTLLEISNTFGVRVFMEEGASESAEFWGRTPLTMKIGLTQEGDLIALNFFLDRLTGKPIQIQTVKGSFSELEFKFFVVGR